MCVGGGGMTGIAGLFLKEGPVGMVTWVCIPFDIQRLILT